MQITISKTDLKAVVGYLEAYAATRSPTMSSSQQNKIRMAIVLKRKLEKKLSL